VSQKMRCNVYSAERAPDCRQLKSQSIAPLFDKTRDAAQKVNDVASSVNAKTMNAFERGTSEWEVADTDMLLDSISDNLVDPLPRQTDRISDLLERLAGSTSSHNSRISLFVGSRARLQRPPLPSGNLLKGGHPVCRKFAGPLPLTDVTDPSAKADFAAVNNLDVQRGNIGAAHPLRVLDERGHVHEESVCVVHEMYNNGSESKKRRRLQKVISTIDGGGKDRA